MNNYTFLRNSFLVYLTVITMLINEINFRQNLLRHDHFLLQHLAMKKE